MGALKGERQRGIKVAGDPQSRAVTAEILKNTAMGSYNRCIYSALWKGFPPLPYRSLGRGV